MKKSLIVVLSMLFVLGFYASASATDVTVGGEVMIRGEFNTNTTDFNSDVEDNAAFYEQRVRLSADAKVTSNTVGFIELESGHANNEDVFIWGEESGATGGYTEGNAKRGVLRIRQAYILHKGSGLLGNPAGMKVGHIVFTLGKGLFYDRRAYGDDAIILFVEPQKGTEASLIYLKLDEGNATPGGAGTDDANAYVLALKHTLNNMNLSADVTYLDDQDGTTAVPAPDGLHFWNIGLRCDSTVAGLAIKGDVEIQTGKAKNPAGDTKYTGWALLLGGDYALNNLTVGAEFAYGSGNKIDTGDEYEGLVTSLDNWDPHYTFVYEYRAYSAAAVTEITDDTIGNNDGVCEEMERCEGQRGTGLMNTWYIKVGADMEVNPDLSVGADLYYLRAARKISNIYTSKDIGWELDANLTYKIDKNLVYFVEGGYLWADDLFKNFTAPTVGADVDNPYAIRHGLKLLF